MPKTVYVNSVQQKIPTNNNHNKMNSNSTGGGKNSQQQQQQQQQQTKAANPASTNTAATEITSVVIKDELDPSSYAQMTLNSFWPMTMGEVRRIQAVDAKNQQLPLARIKKIMKLDEDVKMISAEVPLLFAKAAEIFIHELTLMAWVFTEENKRRTLQRSDIAMALSKHDQFDFLIDIVPREEVNEARATKKEPQAGTAATTSATKSGDEESGTTTVVETDPNKPDSSAQIQYYLQLAQQQRQAITLQNINNNSSQQGNNVLSQGGVGVGTVAVTGDSAQAGTSAGGVQVTGAGVGGLPAGSLITTAGGQTIPLATLLQAQPNQHILNQIQFQGHAQPQQHQQIIQLSNGQHILVGGGATMQQQQQHQHQATHQIVTAGGQVIGTLPQQQVQPQQFHIVQQIMGPNGEIQHIQIPVATNNLNLLRMGGGGGASVQPQQILIQSPQQQQQQLQQHHTQGQIMATTANGGTVFLNAGHQIVATTSNTSAGSAAAGGSSGTATISQVKAEKGTP